MTLRAWVIPFLVACGALACYRTAVGPFFEVPVDATAPVPRYGPDCAAAIARARAEPTPPGIRSPAPTSVVVPPRRAPKSVRGMVIEYEVPVDSAGRADSDAAVLRGVDDPGYATRFRRLLRQMQFRPAMLDGCGVPGIARIKFEIY